MVFEFKDIIKNSKSFRCPTLHIYSWILENGFYIPTHSRKNSTLDYITDPREVIILHTVLTFKSLQNVIQYISTFYNSGFSPFRQSLIITSSHMRIRTKLYPQCRPITSRMKVRWCEYAVDTIASIASCIRCNAESVPIVMSVPQKSLSIEPTKPTMCKWLNFVRCSAVISPAINQHRYSWRPSQRRIAIARGRWTSTGMKQTRYLIWTDLRRVLSTPDETYWHRLANRHHRLRLDSWYPSWSNSWPLYAAPLSPWTPCI